MREESDLQTSNGDDRADDRRAQAARLEWRRPQLRRIAAKDAQSKHHLGVEMTRHLTS